MMVVVESIVKLNVGVKFLMAKSVIVVVLVMDNEREIVVVVVEILVIKKF